jgi:hypothetical protein
MWCTLYAVVHQGFGPGGSRPAARLPDLVARNTTLKFPDCDFIESAIRTHLKCPAVTKRGCGLARYGDGLQRSLRSLCSQMMNNGSTEFKMMTRWSTDACRRDPSIVSSNLTNPTFLLTLIVMSAVVQTLLSLKQRVLAFFKVSDALGAGTPEQIRRFLKGPPDGMTCRDRKISLSFLPYCHYLYSAPANQ